MTKPNGDLTSDTYRFGGWVAYDDEAIDWERVERDGWPVVLKREEPKIISWEDGDPAGPFKGLLIGMAISSFFWICVFIFVRLATRQ